jgi:hypothetical protein
MSTFRRAAVCLVLFLTAGWVVWSQNAAKSVSLATVIPSDTRVYISVPDLPSLVDAFAGSAFGTLSREPEVKDFLDPLMAMAEEQGKELDQQAQQLTGRTIDELSKAFDGQIAFALVDLDPETINDSPDSVDVVFAFDFVPGADGLKSILGEMIEGGVIPGELTDAMFGEHAGWSIGNEEFSLHLGLIGKTVFAANHEERLTSILAAGEGGLEESLATNQNFAAAVKTGGGEDIVFGAYFNVGWFWELAKTTGGPSDRELAMLEASGLMDIDAVALGAAFKDGWFREHVWVHTPEQKGFVAWAAEWAKTSGRSVEWVPADALGSVRVNTAPESLWRAIRAMAAAEIGEERVARDVQRFEEEIGLKVDELAGCMDGTALAWWAFPPAGGLVPDGYLNIGLNKPDVFWSAVSVLLEEGGVEIAETSYREKTIKYLTWNPGSELARELDPDNLARNPEFAILAGVMSLAWMEDDNEVLFCSSVQAAKRLIRNGKPANAATFTDGVSDSHLDLGRLSLGWWNTLMPFAMRFGGMMQAEGVPVDMNRLPTGETLADHLGEVRETIRSTQTTIHVEYRSRIGLGSFVAASAAAGFVLASGSSVGRESVLVETREMNASLLMRTLVNVQAMVKFTDADGNGVEDYWTGDVAGLYGMQDAAGNRIMMIPRSMAAADAAALENYGLEATGQANQGYLFRVMTTDETGAVYQLDGDGDGDAVTHPQRFGICAYPETYEPGKKTLIVNQMGVVYSKDNGGTAVMTWPKDPEEEGWKAE